MSAERIVSFVDEALGNSSYLVDCGDGRALVVDPVRDVTAYLDCAKSKGVTIAFALETHLHADFISGSRDLAANGAEILAPAGSDLAFDHRPIHGGETIQIGNVTVRAVATPGHTPEHLAYLIAMDGEAGALFSGGALLPGTVARTDLIAPDQTEPLARALYRSIHQHIAPLPDDLIVLPTHGGGSFCSAASGGERTTTVGRERTVNPVFTSDEDSFVKELVAGAGSFPSYFLHLRDLNRQGAIVHAKPLPLKRLGLDDARSLIARGAEIIDVRPVAAWARGHIPRSLSIELRAAFASWLGWLVDIDRSLVFVLDADQDRSELVRECLKIGYENLAGEIDGGMNTWRKAGLPEAIIDAVSIEDVTGSVLDVRQDNEYVAGHLPGAFHVELGSIMAAADQTLPNEPIAVMCGHGERAATAASLLERAGRTNTRLMIGGPQDWRRATGQDLQIGLE